MEELASLTDKLSVEIAEGEQYAPCVKVFRADGSFSGLAFHGVPGGHEFTSFVLGLYNAAGPGQPLDADALKAIRSIEKRIDIMVEQGLVDEVRRLLDSGVPADCQAMKAIGYKEIVPFLRGEADWPTTDYLLKLNTRHYAKRQLTWMRREEDVLWVDAMLPDAYDQIVRWYTQGE
jgi:hypothetical protein